MCGRGSWIINFSSAPLREKSFLINHVSLWNHQNNYLSIENLNSKNKIRTTHIHNNRLQMPYIMYCAHIKPYSYRRSLIVDMIKFAQIRKMRELNRQSRLHDRIMRTSRPRPILLMMAVSQYTACPTVERNDTHNTLILIQNTYPCNYKMRLRTYFDNENNVERFPFYA